jgi:hypothetical protein
LDISIDKIIKETRAQYGVPFIFLRDGICMCQELENFQGSEVHGRDFHEHGSRALGQARACKLTGPSIFHLSQYLGTNDFNAFTEQVAHDAL